MPENIVSASSVNRFKGLLDKRYAHLRFCTDINDMFLWKDQSTGLMAYDRLKIDDDDDDVSLVEKQN